MKLATAPYLHQAAEWPTEGENILAHYDDTSVVVYQAYRPSIGRYAIEHGRFGGPDYSFERMSWVKPNFLWMMYRCGWGTKEGQEVVLGLRIRRAFFETVLDAGVPSAFAAEGYASPAAWQDAVAASEVRRQWDPDHAPSGARLQRRAIQLGLRGSLLRAFATTELLEVIDMTDFVALQRVHAQDGNPRLVTPVERVYRRLHHGCTDTGQAVAIGQGQVHDASNRRRHVHAQDGKRDDADAYRHTGSGPRGPKG